MRREYDRPAQRVFDGSDQFIIKIPQVGLSCRDKVTADCGKPFPFHAAARDVPFQVLPYVVQLPHDAPAKLRAQPITV